MHSLLRLTATIAGVLGTLICAISGLSRIFGLYYIAGYQSTTIFTAGMALMVFACLIKLEVLAAKQ